jgi:hypothetical protein
MRLILGMFSCFLLLGNATAQINPLTAIGKIVTTSMDARSKAEVAADTEISAGASTVRGVKGVKSLESHLRVVSAKK